MQKLEEIMIAEEAARRAVIDARDRAGVAGRDADAAAAGLLESGRVEAAARAAQIRAESRAAAEAEAARISDEAAAQLEAAVSGARVRLQDAAALVAKKLAE